MRKLNKVKKLNRKPSHRKAMINNMLTSFLKHERMVSTKARVKVVQQFAEKLITRAKKVDSAQNDMDKLHQKRMIFRTIKDRDIAAKLFDDIGVRNRERPGGYTRVINLPPRKGDASQMAMLELVEYREPQKKQKSSDKNAEKEAKKK